MKDMVSVERRNIERACETWDWARTAGVSAEELRKALLEAQEADGGKIRGQSPEPADAS